MSGGLNLTNPPIVGTSGNDSISVRGTVTFVWVPDPQNSYTWTSQSYDWIGTGGETDSAGTGPSTATGVVMFDGVAASEAFSASASDLQFHFSGGGYGDRSGLGWTNEWSWNPATGVLDPGGSGGSTDNWIGTFYTATGAEFATAHWDGNTDDKESGHWVLASDTGDVNVFAGAGDDAIHGGPGRELLSGGSGNDDIWAGAGSETVAGGSGNDKIWGGVGAETISGGAGNDTIVGNNGAKVIEGGAGSDAIWAGDGDGTVLGGAGSDAIWGATGAQQIYAGVGDDNIWGGTGTQVLSGGAGDDGLWGGVGTQTVSGGAGNDKIWGGNGQQMLSGGAGSDTIAGGLGAQYLDGGAGDDVIYAGMGNETLLGGAGRDTFVFAGAAWDQGRDVIEDFKIGTDVVRVTPQDYGLPNRAPQDLALRATADASGSAVLDLGVGGTVTFAGVSVHKLIAHAAEVFIVSAS